MSVSLVNVMNQTQDPLKKGLLLKATNESVFLRILTFVIVDGLAYSYSEFTKMPGVAFRGIGESYTADNGIVNPAQEQLAILGGTVQTDYQLANKSGGQAARANAILAKTRKAGLFYDKYVIDGDPAVAAKQFRGLKTRIVGSQLKEACANGGELTLDLVDELLDTVAGKNTDKVLIMNKRQRRKLGKLYRPSAGGENARFIDNYEGARIEVLDEDGDEAAILPQTETQGNSSACSSIYCIRPGTDLEGEWVQGLIGGKLIDQYDGGQSGTQLLDVVEMNAGLAVFHGRAAARLQGLL